MIAAWAGTWHPVAERFPMLTEEELRRLADSITETGQLHPCLMTPDGTGLDGRNRVAACKIAGTEPLWAVTEAEPVGVIVAGNVRHRHLTPSQQVMATAIALEAQGKRSNGRWERGSVPDAPDTYKSTSTWALSVSRAGVIIDYRPDLVDDVLRGVALDNAYQQAKAAKDEQEENAEKLAQLPDDLAALVENGVRDIDDALAEVEDRETVGEVDEIRSADGAPGPSFAARASEGAITWSEAATLAENWGQEREDGIRRSQERIRQINSAWGVIRTVLDQFDRPYVKEILNGLGDADREAFSEVLTTLRKQA